MAGVREQSGDVPGTKQAYEDALEAYQQDEKDYNLGDVYKQYIGFLVRAKAFEDAVKTIDCHIALLVKQKHFTFVHKEALAKIVIFIHMQDTVRAEEALNTPCEVQGWYTSKECMVGSEMVEAFKTYDAEAVTRLLKEQVWSFLQVEVARMAKQLKVKTVAVPTQQAAPRVAPVAAAVPAAPAAPPTGGYESAAPPVAPTSEEDAPATSAVPAAETEQPKAETVTAPPPAAVQAASPEDLADMLM